MPKVLKTTDFLQRLAELEDAVAAMQRAGATRDEVPFYPTGFKTFVYDDATSFATLWETIFTPRMATLSLGLVFIGDQVSGVNSGGEWRVQINDTITAGSGSVPATFTYTLPTLTVDLLPYRQPDLKVQIQVRRTSGATTGGRFGGGGSIGGAPRYARLL